MKKLMKKISVLVALVLILCMVACPISAVSESEFLTLQTPGENLRNDYPGFVGMKFTVGRSDLTITALGRLFYGGALGANDEEHEVRIVSADHTLVTSVVIPAGGTDGKVTYAPLKEKVVLKAGASYYLASLESTTDYWYGSVSEGGATFKMTGVATCNGAFYQTDEEALHYNLYDVVGPFVGVSFKYVSSGKEPSSTETISTMAEVANFVDMSYSYFSRSFKRTFNIGFGKYVMNVRIKRAKQELAYSTKSINEISTLLGFNSPRYFSVVFKEAVGCSPKDYRRSNGRGEKR